jgi:RimJ/RimL family protein N-acetyltransferase
LATFETARLLLRPFAERDLDEYSAIVGDADVCRYLGHAPMTRDEAWRSMASFLGHEQLRGWSNNAVVDKATSTLLGRCGLWQPEGWPGLEVGWTFGRFAWGNGYATEAALAWRRYAFDVLGVRELISVIHRDNAASMAVARRIGHEYWRDVEVRGFPCVIYGQRSTDGR